MCVMAIHTAGHMLVFFYELYTWPGYLVIMMKVSPIRLLSKSKERSGIELSQLVFEGKKAVYRYYVCYWSKLQLP